MTLSYVGNTFAKFNVENKPVVKMGGYGLLWASTLLLTYILASDHMELAWRRYTLYPVCYLTAIAGTLMVVEFSVLISKFKIIYPLLYLGKNSLYMLCIHIVDEYLFKSLWNLTDNVYVNSVCRILVDTIIFAVLMLFVEMIQKYRKCSMRNK